MPTDLSSKALLATLSVSVLGVSKTDKAITESTNANYGADKNAGRFNKTLISKDYLKPITDIRTKARDYHKAHTLPWHDRGGRLLPAKKHTDYMTQMRAYKADFETAVDDFINEYDQAINESRNHLGQMFDENDYMSKSEIIGKFKFEVDIDPVPTEDDFRTSLSDNEIAELKKNLMTREQARQDKAIEDIRERIINVMEPFVSKLSDPKGRVFDAYVENAKQLVDILPSLNLDDDPQIDQICADIRTRLCTVDTKDIRKDPDVKKQVSDEAKDIMSKYNLSTDQAQAA